MKMKKLFLGLFACSALCACSNDESGIIPDDTPKIFTVDEAYLNVRLADAGSLTRAQEGEFEYGTNEQSVKNAYFTFTMQTAYSLHKVMSGRVATPRRQTLPATLNLRATTSSY